MPPFPLIEEKRKHLIEICKRRCYNIGSRIFTWEVKEKRRNPQSGKEVFMSSAEFLPVAENEMTLERYPCGFEAGDHIVPAKDLYGSDEAGNSFLYLKKGRRCLVLTGDPEKPDIVRFRICATGEVGTWDSTVRDSFEPAPPKPAIRPDMLSGKNLLIGITRYDAADREIDRSTHFGPVVEVSDTLVSILETGKQEYFTIPFDPDAFEESDRHLAFTFEGVTVSEVDFISLWRIRVASPE